MTGERNTFSESTPQTPRGSERNLRVRPVKQAPKQPAYWVFELNLGAVTANDSDSLNWTVVLLLWLPWPGLWCT